MKRVHRNISWIHLAAAAAVCFMFVTAARADQLIANDFQGTSSSAIETTPTLGSDNGASVLVYTSIDLATFTSRVRYQLLTDTGTLGPAVDVGSGSTNDNLNDVSGDLIVYTATQPSNPGIRQIRKYRISDGFDTGISGFGAMGEARIHGGNIAWIEGTTIFLSVAGATEFRIAGPVPAASELEIGDSFVVWQQDGDIWEYDLVNGSSSKAANGGNNPSTSGSWAVWESAGIVQGLNLLSGATVALGDAANVNANPSIDGNNIAWESNAAGNFDIYLHRIAEGDTFMVTTNLADQQLDSLHGGQVAYLDNRNGLDIWVSTFSFAADPLPDPDMDIDIKPGSDPNGVNPRSKGVIPVAVLGSVDFDATQVDFSTVVFGPGPASPVHNGHVENVNGDGFDDMVFHFKVSDTGIACGDPNATLTGETFGGDSITGTDPVQTVGCNSSGGGGIAMIFLWLLGWAAISRRSRQ